MMETVELKLETNKIEIFKKSKEKIEVIRLENQTKYKKFFIQNRTILKSINFLSNKYD